jgi:predicted LPLAT superfamily acyltransferase
VAAWKGKTRGGITGYKIFITVLKYLGLPFAYFLLRFVALYFFLFNTSSFRNIFIFYRKRLGYNLAAAVTAVYRNYYVFGQVILDKVLTMGGFGAKFTFDFDGEHHLHKMVSDQSGGLLISAHIGNFEMAGHLLERLHTKVNVVMLDAEHQQIKNYLSAVTRKSYHIIPIGADNAHLFDINNAFAHKEIVCMHGDRFMKGSKTLACKFLGKEAYFPTGPFYLAMKYQIPVSFVFAMKESDSHYHFYASPPVIYAQQSTPLKRNEAISAIIQDYIAMLEEKIKSYPYQWFNYYNFWNEPE